MSEQKNQNSAAGGQSELSGLVMREMLSALEIAQAFCNSFTAEECPDRVAIPISDAINAARKCLGKNYFAEDGTPFR